MSRDGDLPPADLPDGGDRIQQLARELGRLARDEPERLKRSVGQLSVREQAELALRLPAQQRLELLLHAPKPMRLVRTLPDADLYLTVREVGPAESLPLLALASPSQVQHLFDLESWRHDQFDADRAGAWAATLLEAGEAALKRFLRTVDTELLALLFRRWMKIEMIEYEDSPEKHGHGEGDAGTEQGYITPDGYHRFSPTIPEHVPAIRGILQYFYVNEPERYRSIVWESIWKLPSEMEEQLLHWRNSRLHTHGFPDWEEALSVYAPPEGVRALSDPPRSPDGEALAASRRPLMSSEIPGPLTMAIDALQGAERERVLHEVVSVANHLLVADSADTGDPQAHKRAMRKTLGYVDIALERRIERGESATPSVLRQVPVIELFREGYAPAAQLQARARELTTRGWASTHPRAVELLDEPVQGLFRGLLDLRPRFAELDELELTVGYRDFRSSEELGAARAALEMSETVGVLFFDRLELKLAGLLESLPAESAAPTFSTLFLTLLAWHSARGELRGDPLPDEVSADFLRNVASRRTAPPEAAPRATESLVRGLTGPFGLDPREISVLQAFGRFCVERLTAECARLDPGVPLDSRQIGCLLLEGR